jgi:hypothetical protein
MGIVYCALPVADTPNCPGVRPTAASAFALNTNATMDVRTIGSLLTMGVGSVPFWWVE